MLKIYIGDTEVVSSNEISIKEEFLNPSSVILNNVMPKSWEDERNYTGFYHFKDYDKCKILDRIDHEEIEGTTVEGTSLSIDYNNEYDFEYKLLGQTEQDGTPTPDNPYPVKVVTGDNQIVITNQNGTETQAYPLTLGTMELCKIGDYQDYIYYSNGNWYKKEYIGKKIFDGSENWGLNYNSSMFRISANDILPRVSTPSHLILSNYYTNNNYGEMYASRIDYGIEVGDGTNKYIYIRNVDITSVSNFKTWLSTHNTTVYYVLETSIDVQITDTTLINQLNNISLLNGTNNIVITGDDLPPIMNLHYNFKEAYTEENLLFCGVVKNSGNISLNPRYPHFSSLQVIDFKTFLSEGETLDFVISNKTVSEAIDQVINAISDYGFVLGNIQIFGADDVIGAYNCENKTAYDVFQYLSEITGSRWFTRMIDQNTVAIDFYDPTLMTSGQNIEYTTEWFENNNVEDLSYNYGTYDYRNKQIMESDKVFANIDYTENIVADGYAKIFQTSTSIGVVKSITAGGVSKTFATNSDKELGVEADFYYTPNEVNLETDATYSAGTVITIVYTPLVKGRRVIRNYDEITRIAGQTNRRGTIARYETRNDVTDGSELEKIGETYLKYKGSPEINLKLVVRDNDIYSIGQVAYFDAPLEDLQTEYLLKTKTTNIITDNNQFIYQYVYEFTSSFNVENEVNYFDNQRNKAKGNIAEGEYIIRDVDIDEQANIIFHNLTISEVTVSDDNILEAALESPLTK